MLSLDVTTLPTSFPSSILTVPVVVIVVVVPKIIVKKVVVTIVVVMPTVEALPSGKVPLPTRLLTSCIGFLSHVDGLLDEEQGQGSFA